MPRDAVTDPDADRDATTQAYLEALTLARKARSVRSARLVRWYLVALVAFVVTWAIGGFSVAITVACAAGVALLALLSANRLPSINRQVAALNAPDLRNIELTLLQHLVNGAAPWMRIRGSSPVDAQLVAGSGLIRERIDFVSAGRCLTGLHDGRTPVCATHIETSRLERIHVRGKVPEQRVTPGFRGLFVIADLPETSGWVTLESTGAGPLHNLVSAARASIDRDDRRIDDDAIAGTFVLRASSDDDYRHVLDCVLVSQLVGFRSRHADGALSIAIRDGTIMLLVPMHDSPFVFRDNPAVWEQDIRRLAHVVGMVEDLLDAVARRVAHLPPLVTR